MAADDAIARNQRADDSSRDGAGNLSNSDGFIVLRLEDDQVRFIDLRGFFGAGIEVSPRPMSHRDHFGIAGCAIDVDIEHAEKDPAQNRWLAIGGLMTVEPFHQTDFAIRRRDEIMRI